jgi:VanZ family protein
MLLFFNQIFRKPYLAILATVVACFLMFFPKLNEDVEVVDILGFPIDKIAHFIMFLGIAFLWKRYFLRALWLPVALVIFAVFTEVIQYLLPTHFGRSFEMNDIFADCIGIGLGFLASVLFDKFLIR